MKKTAVLAAGIALILSGTALAAEPVTLSDRIDRVDEVIYGSVQTGSLIGRLDNADNVIYGNGNTTASGLDDRIATCIPTSSREAQIRLRPCLPESMQWNIT